MNTEDGSYMVDDELFSSHAKEVKVKWVLQPKVGTDGPIANCLACLLVRVLLGLRLRVSDESHNQNVQTLLGNNPEIAHAGHHTSL